jgi:RecB family exonuclease
MEKEPVSERLMKTKKELKGCGGSSQCDLQENYIYSGKNWLLRKSMVSRTFKFASNGRLNKRKFNSDLMHLIMNYHYSGWWRTRKITENRNKPNEIHNPSYSYSSLSTFEECPLKYKLKYLFNIGEEKNLAIFVGSLYHEILKAFFNQPEKDYSWQNLKKAVINTFSSDKYEFEFNYLRNEVFQKALRDFRRFHEYFIKGKELNVMSEKEFSFMIDGDLIRGRIDQINLISDTEAQLIDFKSGSRNFSAADIQKDLQLRIYRMAIDLCSDLDFIKGRDISLKYVFIGDEKNKDPSVLLPDSIYDTDDFQRYLKSIIKKVKSEHFIADPEDYLSCKFCGYRLLCPNKNA